MRQLLIMLRLLGLFPHHLKQVTAYGTKTACLCFPREEKTPHHKSTQLDMNMINLRIEPTSLTLFLFSLLWQITKVIVNFYFRLTTLPASITEENYYDTVGGALLDYSFLLASTVTSFSLLYKTKVLMRALNKLLSLFKDFDFTDKRKLRLSFKHRLLGILSIIMILYYFYYMFTFTESHILDNMFYLIGFFDVLLFYFLACISMNNLSIIQSKLLKQIFDTRDYNPIIKIRAFINTFPTYSKLDLGIRTQVNSAIKVDNMNWNLRQREDKHEGRSAAYNSTRTASFIKQYEQIQIYIDDITREIMNVLSYGIISHILAGVICATTSAYFFFRVLTVENLPRSWYMLLEVLITFTIPWEYTNLGNELQKRVSHLIHLKYS